VTNIQFLQNNFFYQSTNIYQCHTTTAGRPFYKPTRRRKD